MLSHSCITNILSEMQSLDLTSRHNNLGNNYNKLYNTVTNKFNRILNSIIIKHHSKKIINNNYKGVLVIDILKSISDLDNKHIKFLKKHNFEYSVVEEYINYNGKEINDIIYNNVDRTGIINDIINTYGGDGIISTFIPINIQNEILQMNKLEKIVYNYKNNIINMNIYSKKNTLNIYQKIFLATRIFLTIELYNLKDIEININYYLSKQPKQYPNNSNTYLGSKEINSGLTSHNGGSKIYIYRLEEIEKVTIHEVLHALKIDYNLFISALFSNKYSNKFKCHFNISNDTTILINESYVESCTFIINSILTSYISNISYNSVYDSELQFAILQCNKILKFYKIENIRKFYSKISCYKNNKNWIEKTSVVCYFLFKLFLIYYPEKFIDELMFEKNITGDIIYKYIIDNIDNIIGDIDHNKYLTTNTLKMTLFETVYL